MSKLIIVERYFTSKPHILRIRLTVVYGIMMHTGCKYFEKECKFPNLLSMGQCKKRRTYSALAMGYVFPAQTQRYVTKQRQDICLFLLLKGVRSRILHGDGVGDDNKQICGPQITNCSTQGLIAKACAGTS